MVKKKDTSKPISTTNIIVKLLFIGFFSLIACVVIGIVFVQLIGWGVDCIIKGLHNNNWFVGKGNYVSDFLGGALGLTIGLVLDKICIDKINSVYQYRSFMRIIKHEIKNIKKVLKNNIVQIKQNGQINSIKEFIVDDVVTSAQTISIISSIPYSKEALNCLVDKISDIHMGIIKHNELIDDIEKEVILIKTLLKEKTITGKEVSKDKYNSLIKNLKESSIELSERIDDFLDYTK